MAKGWILDALALSYRFFVRCHRFRLSLLLGRWLGSGGIVVRLGCGGSWKSRTESKTTIASLDPGRRFVPIAVGIIFVSERLRSAVK